MNRRKFLQTLTAAPIVVAVIPYTKGLRTEIVAPEASEALSHDVTTDYWGNETYMGMDMAKEGSDHTCYLTKTGADTWEIYNGAGIDI